MAIGLRRSYVLVSANLTMPVSVNLHMSQRQNRDISPAFLLGLGRYLGVSAVAVGDDRSGDIAVSENDALRIACTKSNMSETLRNPLVMQTLTRSSAGIGNGGYA